jgi:hypothetical protein
MTDYPRKSAFVPSANGSVRYVDRNLSVYFITRRSTVIRFNQWHKTSGQTKTDARLSRINSYFSLAIASSTS